MEKEKKNASQCSYGFWLMPVLEKVLLDLLKIKFESLVTWQALVYSWFIIRYLFFLVFFFFFPFIIFLIVIHLA